MHIWSLDSASHVLISHVVIEENIGIEKMTDIKTEIRKIISELGVGEFYTAIEFESGREICLAKVWGHT